MARDLSSLPFSPTVYRGSGSSFIFLFFELFAQIMHKPLGIGEPFVGAGNV